jgi:hypothetical protein
MIAQIAEEIVGTKRTDGTGDVAAVSPSATPFVRYPAAAKAQWRPKSVVATTAAAAAPGGASGGRGGRRQ